MSRKKIEIDNSIGQFETDLYSNKNKLIGTITTPTSLLNVRVQIKEQKLEGYYLKFQGRKIDIYPNGKMSEWPDEFYEDDRLLTILLGV